MTATKQKAEIRVIKAERIILELEIDEAQLLGRLFGQLNENDWRTIISKTEGGKEFFDNFQGSHKSFSMDFYRAINNLIKK